MKFTYPSGSRPLDGYTIKRGVGQGGFGEVYYATSDGGKEVALKLIRRNLDVELRGVSQCLNLKHPNLVALFDTRVDAHGDSWVVMEYVPGESLEEEIHRHPKGLPLPEALSWFHGIAAGVGYLHDRGIVHRDLKPGNIFNDEGVVKIGDYGLSKFISASRRSGQTESVGTVHYMAPEIANGRYGKEIDIYALGIILYELLTGQVPFEGESVGEVLMKHLTATPNVDLAPEPYRAVLAHLLEKDPQRRIHNVAELLTALPASSSAPAARPSIPFRSRVESPLAETTLLVPRPPAPPPPPRPQPHGFGAEDSLPRELGGAMRKFRSFWNPMPTSTKVLCCLSAMLLFGAVSGGIGGHDVRPSLMGSLLFFGLTAYRVRKYVRAAQPAADRSGSPLRGTRTMTPAVGPAFAAADVPSAPPQATYYRRERRVRRRSPSLRMVPVRSPRDRLTELIGSMLLAAAVAAAATLVMLIVQRSTLQTEYVWLALSATVGAWGILIPAKFWEGRHGDAVLRRFIQLAVGLSLGLFAWSIDSLLLANLTNDMNLPSVNITVPGAHAVDGQPQMFSYLAYFGFLFLLVRWWKQADPLRSSRLSIWATVVCVFWAAILNVFWAFPQPWGMMAAGTISVAIQLASPWIDPRERMAFPATPTAA